MKTLPGLENLPLESERRQARVVVVVEGNKIEKSLQAKSSDLAVSPPSVGKIPRRHFPHLQPVFPKAIEKTLFALSGLVVNVARCVCVCVSQVGVLDGKNK